MSRRALLFFGGALAVWALGHLYIGWRLIVPARLAPSWNGLAWSALAALVVLGPAALIAARHLGDDGFARALHWTAYAHLGLFLLLLPLLAARDLGWLLALGVAAATRRDATDPERRRLMLHALNVALLGLTGALSGAAFVTALRRARVVDVEVPIDGLPPALQGFRIALVSDIHLGPTIRGGRLRAIVEDVNALDADVVAVTGDLVDGRVEDMRAEVAPLGDLRARHGTFFVTGNHEYYWDARGWTREVQRLGLTVLTNEHRVIERDGARLVLAGVTDYTAGRFVPEHASDPGRALRDAPPAGVKVLLAHQPRSAFAASRVGYDLQLSGHTHGGQSWPWNHLIALVQPFMRGLHRVGRMWLYVNPGTGYWGPPQRLGVPAEITRVTLVRAGG